MADLSPDVSAALATLRSRWGAAAPRAMGEAVGSVIGALATVPDPLQAEPPAIELDGPSQRDPDRVRSTGFPALDAILGPGGLPRGVGLSLRGDGSSGRTTLALRLAAEAQADGAIVAWLDLAAAFDPVEAVARGVRPDWLVVLTPTDGEEGLTIAGSLLAGRAIDLLVMDLPPRLPAPARFADRLGRVAALARRAGIGLVVLEPPGLAPGIAGAVGEGTGIRLELARRAWIRLGRDVVGQVTDVLVARSRIGPPGRQAGLRILYADGGERDACLHRDDLLSHDLLSHDLLREAPAPVALRVADPNPVHAPAPVPGTNRHATASPPQTPAPPGSRPPAPALRVMAGGSDRGRRPTLDRRDGPGRESRGPRPRHPARAAAGLGPPAQP